MKKVILAIMLVLSLMVMASCGTGNDNKGSAYAYDKFATDGYKVIMLDTSYGVDNNVVKLIRTWEEFQKFLVSTEMSNAAEQILKPLEKYNEDYFKTNYLIFIADWQTSGSIKLSVKSIGYKSDCLIVNTEAVVPDIGTCDMRLWVFYIEIKADPSIQNVLYNCSKVHG